MMRPTNTPLTASIAREVCQRAASKAMITGAIASLGNEYVIGLKAVNCHTGETLAQEQVTAPSKEQVLDSLGGAASKLRGALGESLASVEKLDVPLQQATTNSLEALKQYSLQYRAMRQQGAAAALPYGLRAITIDPNFALAIWAVGGNYRSLSELSRASEYFARAFELRDRVSERERLLIEAYYYLDFTGQVDKATQTYREWVENYPRDLTAWGSLAIAYLEQGQYDLALTTNRRFLELAPNNVSGYINLGVTFLGLGRIDDARKMISDATAHGLEDENIHVNLYATAFVSGDAAAMAKESSWLESKPEYATLGFALESDSEAYAGHLQKAREILERAVDSAMHADSVENAATWRANASLREATFGNVAESRRSAETALKLAPSSKGVALEAALAYAISGENSRAQTLEQDFSKRYPLDTQVQSLWLPTIDAQVDLNKGDAADAIERLKTVVPIETAMIPFTQNLSCLYPTYVRGQAYLALGKGNEAAAEFQKIVDHPGMVWNCQTGALAWLGLARARAIEARNNGADPNAMTNAKHAYEDFLARWKSADDDIPILVQAKAEAAKVN
jgi:eukaryotic-like serine/threonine-protein kinase